jgi:hypothetical protein
MGTSNKFIVKPTDNVEKLSFFMPSNLFVVIILLFSLSHIYNYLRALRYLFFPFHEKKHNYIIDVLITGGYSCNGANIHIDHTNAYAKRTPTSILMSVGSNTHAKKKYTTIIKKGMPIPYPSRRYE